MTKQELIELSKKGKTQIAGFPCEVKIKREKDGDLFIEIVFEPLSPLHQPLYLGGVWLDYVSDEEVEHLEDAVLQYKAEADDFCRKAERVCKAKLSKDGQHFVMTEIPDSVKADWDEIEKVLPNAFKHFAKEEHPFFFLDKEKKAWRGFRFSLDIEGHLYTPKWSYWLDQPYYEVDEFIKSIKKEKENED